MSVAVYDVPAPENKRPRLGFLGVGWIGRHRMEAIADSGVAQVVGIADPAEDLRAAAAQAAPEADCVSGLEELLRMPLDGLVIATPSALHAEQTMEALQRGIAVFCQKPLGRTAAETRQVVRAARSADRLLAVDLSYRNTTAVQALRQLVQQGALGKIYAVRASFHNAYGPDKPWFHDRKLSGGGCVMDLGIHLVDLALWLLDHPPVESISSRLFAEGQRLVPPIEQVEHYATATIDVEGGASIDLACSWNLPAGRDAVIELALFGTQGGAALRNVNGSFYDFVAERFRGTSTEELCGPPDPWGGRTAVAWAQRLAVSAAYDAEIESLVQVSECLDGIYGISGSGARVLV